MLLHLLSLCFQWLVLMAMLHPGPWKNLHAKYLRLGWIKWIFEYVNHAYFDQLIGTSCHLDLRSRRSSLETIALKFSTRNSYKLIQDLRLPAEKLSCKVRSPAATSTLTNWKYKHFLPCFSSMFEFSFFLTSVWVFPWNSLRRGENECVL